MVDIACGLNSKQLASCLLELSRSEQTLAAEYAVKPIDPCAIWGLRKDPVVGEGSAWKMKKKFVDSKFSFFKSTAITNKKYLYISQNQRENSRLLLKENEKKIQVHWSII